MLAIGKPWWHAVGGAGTGESSRLKQTERKRVSFVTTRMRRSAAIAITCTDRDFNIVKPRREFNTLERLKQLELCRFLPARSDGARQLNLLVFVDTTGSITPVGRNLALYPDVEDRVVIERNFPSYLDTKYREEALQLYNAVEYVQEHEDVFTLDHVLELHKRVLGVASSRIRKEVGDGVFESLLEELNACISNEKGILSDFIAAALFLSGLAKLRPFEDGNARLGEVMLAAALRKWSLFPLRAHVHKNERSYQRLLSSSRGEIADDHGHDDETKLPLPDLVDHLVQRCWKYRGLF